MLARARQPAQELREQLDALLRLTGASRISVAMGEGSSDFLALAILR